MKKSRMAIGLAVGVTVIAAGCTAKESRGSAAQWIGKDRVELAQEMGPPKQAVPSETGGEMLFYSYEGHRYYFQTNVLGQIDSAVRTD